MNLTRAVGIIKRQCGFRQSGDADIIACIQDAQEQIETSYPVEPLPWFLLTERSITSNIDEEERIELPSDFMMEWEEDGLWFQLPSGGEKLLNKYDADDLRAYQSKFSDEQADYNRINYRFAYALTGDYFRIFPTPAEVYSFKMIYYQKQAILVEGTDENRWLKYAPWILIGMAGEVYAHAIRDSIAMSFFQQKKGAAIQSITDFTVSRQIANRRMSMGESL